MPFQRYGTNLAPASATACAGGAYDEGGRLPFGLALSTAARACGLLMGSVRGTGLWDQDVKDCM